MAQNAQFAKENVAYWTRRAPSYSQNRQDELAGAQREVWRAVLTEQIGRRFPGRRPEEIHVLDVGTGPGFFAILLAERGYRVTAVDYTDSMLAEARRNAGSLPVAFRRMDAEQLDFPAASFDVVLSRNVTWNLHDPAAAYRHWARVLKPGGLLLNFDANWYRYLYDGEAMERHLLDRANVARGGVSDDTAGTDVNAMEAIAAKTFLAARRRPEWDMETLRALGLEARADREVWRRVWSVDERVNNASTPLFLVHAVKTAG